VESRTTCAQASRFDEHDFQFKRRNAERFLLEGNKVKSTVIFRGRELVHSEIGYRILSRLAAELTEVALVEVPPRQEGMTMVQILSPKKEQPKAKKPSETGKTAKKIKVANAAQPVAAGGRKAESKES